MAPALVVPLLGVLTPMRELMEESLGSIPVPEDSRDSRGVVYCE